MDTAARDTGQPPDQCLEVGAEAQELGPAAADTPEAAAGAASPELRKQHGVKRHLHKHNLKHRYELQETLGKGTYGKVKRAMERFSGRVVNLPSSIALAFFKALLSINPLLLGALNSASHHAKITERQETARIREEVQIRKTISLIMSFAWVETFE